jgi:hypothetical protein
MNKSLHIICHIYEEDIYGNRILDKKLLIFYI